MGQLGFNLQATFSVSDEPCCANIVQRFFSDHVKFLTLMYLVELASAPNSILVLYKFYRHKWFSLGLQTLSKTDTSIIRILTITMMIVWTAPSCVDEFTQVI